MPRVPRRAARSISAKVLTTCRLTPTSDTRVPGSIRRASSPSSTGSRASRTASPPSAGRQMSERRVNRPWIAAGCCSFSPCSSPSSARHSCSSTSRAPTTAPSDQVRQRQRPQGHAGHRRRRERTTTPRPPARSRSSRVPQNQLDATRYQTTTDRAEGQDRLGPDLRRRADRRRASSATRSPATSSALAIPQGHDRDLGEPDRPRPRRRLHPERLRGRHLRDRSADATARPAPPAVTATSSRPGCCCPRSRCSTSARRSRSTTSTTDRRRRRPRPPSSCPGRCSPRRHAEGGPEGDRRLQGARPDLRPADRQQPRHSPDPARPPCVQSLFK